jgi:tetratricopeptide (TPR) repeat protein
MSERNAKILCSEHQVLIEKIGYFNVKSVLLCLKISQCYRGSNDSKLYLKYITLSFLGALSIDVTEDIQVDICCDLLVALGHPEIVSEGFKNLLASYIRSGDNFGLCNTLAASTREDANHDSVWEHITDMYQVMMLQSLTIEKVHPPFPKSAIIFGYAELLRFRADYSGAIPYYRDSLDLRRELYKADASLIYFGLVGQSVSGFGAALTTTGCYDEAERNLTEALTIRNRLKRERGDIISLLEVAKCSSDIADLFFAKGETHIRRSQDWYQVVVSDLEDVIKLNDISDVLLCRAHVLMDRARGRLGYAIEMQAVMMMRDAHEMVMTSRNNIFGSNSISKLPTGHPTVVETHEMNLFSDRVVGGIESASDIIFSKLDCVFLFKENKIKKKSKLPTGDPVRDEIDRIYNEALRHFNMSRLEESMSMLNECIARAKNITLEEEAMAHSARLSKSAASSETAISTEHEVLKAHPRLADCIYTQAQIFQIQGMYDSASKLYDKAGKINAARQRVIPYAVQCMTGLAECALGKGDAEKSTRILQEVKSLFHCSIMRVAV